MGSLGSKGKKDGGDKVKDLTKNQKFIPPPIQPPMDVELDPIYDNEHLPQQNVRPLTCFEKAEIKRAQCDDSPCDTFQKIQLPSPDYYGLTNKIISNEIIRPRLNFNMPKHVKPFSAQCEQHRFKVPPFRPRRVHRDRYRTYRR